MKSLHQQSSTRQNILVARLTFAEVLDRLTSHFDVELNKSDEVLKGAALQSRLADKDGALLFGRERINVALLANTPRLRAACNSSTGFDNFDLAAMTAANVIGTNTPSANAEAVADFAWGLLLSAARRVRESDHSLRTTDTWRGWSYDLYLGKKVHGATLGIVGMGRIGQAIARCAVGFDMEVIEYKRSGLLVTVEQRLNARHATRDALLRTARVESSANVTLTPHIGSARHEAGLAMAHLAATNLIASLGHGPTPGVPPNTLNPEVPQTNPPKIVK